MGAIFGSLNILDTDRVFNSTVGQDVIYDEAAKYVARINEELNAALAVFVEGPTEEFKLRYKLPGGGYLQRRNSYGGYGQVKATGSWDVAFPLYDFGTALGWNDVDRAYMTVKELENHILTVTAQYVNTIRYEAIKALVTNTDVTFKDPLHGDLTVKPLANGDAVTYPPVLGSDTEATDSHYIETGYATSAISDTNNPYATAADELEEHFGAPTGGSNIAVFINNDASAKTRDLTDFVPVSQMGISYGDDQTMTGPVPAELTRIGRVIGRLEESGVWVCEWRVVPSNYMIGVHLDAPKPLMARVDPADTGLGNGDLQLVYEDKMAAFEKSSWRTRKGFGVGNRLNGVVLELANGGGYTIPTAYA